MTDVSELIERVARAIKGKHQRLYGLALLPDCNELARAAIEASGVQSLSDERDALKQALAALEAEIVAHLKECTKAAVCTGSDFNQGVVRGLEIAAAQIENGHHRAALTKEGIENG